MPGIFESAKAAYEQGVYGGRRDEMHMKRRNARNIIAPYRAYQREITAAMTALFALNNSDEGIGATLAGALLGALAGHFALDIAEEAIAATSVVQRYTYTVRA